MTREDWKKALAALLDTHPGLEFLKSTPEFQERYLECVVERIFYSNSPGESDGMTLREIKKSNLPDVLIAVEEEVSHRQASMPRPRHNVYVCMCLSVCVCIYVCIYAYIHVVIPAYLCGAASPQSRCAEPVALGILASHRFLTSRS